MRLSIVGQFAAVALFAFPAAAQSPATLDSTEVRRWREEADKTLFIQINTIQQKADDSLAVFMRRAINAADSAGAERLFST